MKHVLKRNGLDCHATCRICYPKPETKHTPGPWVARKTTVSSINGTRQLFGVGPVKNGAVWFVAENVYEEDARLIAAAPTMADAIRNLLAEIDADADCPSVGAIRALRDSLAKAEGR